MKKRNLIKRFLCFALCLCMMTGALMNFVSCGDDGEGGGADGGENGDELVEVLRYVKDIDKNDKIVKSSIQLVKVHKDLVPEDALSSENEALGKFVTQPVCAGEFVVSKKLVSKLSGGSTNEDGSSSKEYIIVPENISLAGDISDSLQKLIDNNPNRTLYFPDGVYRLGKTVTTSSDPEKSVSLEFSTYAIVSPHDQWKGKLTDPLINFGGAGKGKGAVANKAGNEMHITGGVFNGEDRCSGITVEGSARALIHNLSMKNVHIGIDIKADYTDVDNVVITGTNTDDAIGVLVQGSYNTLTNMRIFHIHTGIKLLEGKNVLRNLHPLYAGMSDTSCGFWDLSEGNFYDICYSDHFAVGFRMTSDTVSVYNGCFAFWYNGGESTTGGIISHMKHWGFECSDAQTLADLKTYNGTGSFNSIIRNTRVDLNYPKCDSTYLRIRSGGGQGLLLDPTCVGAAANDDHASDYSSYLKTEKH